MGCGLFIISKIYLKGAIGTTINSQSIKRELEKITLKDVKKNNKIVSYLKKEILVMARTPIFCIQCIIIPIVYPLTILSIFVLAVVVSKKIGVDIIAKFLGIINTSLGQAIFIGVGVVFFMMNFCSIIGVSKEGKSAPMTKTLPIKLSKQFDMKLLIGKTLNMLSELIITFAYFYATQNIKATIVIFAILTYLNTIGEKTKLLIDLKKPQISWDNEYTMMKQNTNVMYILFYTLAILGILYIISLIVSSPTVYITMILLIVVIADLIINYHIEKNQKKIFEKVY